MKKRLKKKYLFIIIIIAIILIIGGIIFYNSTNQKISRLIQNCNSYVLQGLSDSCSGYYGNTWSCAHKGDWRNCYANLLYSNEFKTYIGTTSNKTNICYKFLHKGMATECLKRYVEDKQVCLDFAKGDEYLTTICNLDSTKIESLDDYQYKFKPRTYDEF